MYKNELLMKEIRMEYPSANTFRFWRHALYFNQCLAIKTQEHVLIALTLKNMVLTYVRT